MLHLTVRKYPKGSGRYISARWRYRVVDAPEGAKCLDKRNPAVKVLFMSPLLATYWSHGRNIPTAFTRRYSLEEDLARAGFSHLL